MEWESDSPCCSHTYPGQGHRSPGRCSSWELEFRDCGEIPRRALLLTEERQIEGMWGRRLWWEIPVEESQEAMEARQHYWVMLRGWSHHRSLSPPKRWHWKLNNREAGPSKAWCTELQSRTPPRVPLKCLMCQFTEKDPSQGGPSVCLIHWTTEKDFKQGSPLSAWTGGATERDWPKMLSDCQL